MQRDDKVGEKGLLFQNKKAETADILRAAATPVPASLSHPIPSHQKTIDIKSPSVKKTFNGDGPGMVKPLKNHRWQWCLGKKTLPSHRYKKMTIVEVYRRLCVIALYPDLVKDKML